MGAIMDMITGKSAADARKAQALALQQQGVTQARQLQVEATDTAKTALVRRDPRGRRLLADASVSALPSTVG